MCDLCHFSKDDEVEFLHPITMQRMSICDDCMQIVMTLGTMVGFVSDWDSQEEENVSDSNTKTEIQLKTPSQIKAELDKHVIGQEAAKKALSVGIYNHYKRISSGRTDIQKSNIMLVGPTGVGKTELARSIAKILDVPFAIADATSVTEAGYVGDDVENIVLKLIQAADYDIERAQCGIIYLDEADKIARKNESASITRDVSGEGVQQALLKIVEGAEITVPSEGGRKHPYGENISIDTSNILFICGGAFESLTMREIEKEKNLGFCTRMEATPVKQEKHKLEAKDLVKQGMIPEFVGRFPIIVELSNLTEDDLVRILVEPENSITKQYTDLVGMDNVKLKFTDSALRYIAHKASEKKTGARGLRCIIEDAMNDLMFELPDEKDITTVQVSADENGLVFKKHKKKKSA